MTNALFLQLECFCHSYKNIIQFFVAFGTLMSCLISLYLSSRKPKIIMKGELYIAQEVAGALFDIGKIILQQNISPDENYLIVAKINNLNQFPIYLSNPCHELKFCGLKLPVLEISLEAQNNKKAKFPYVVDAFNQASFKCSMSVLLISFDIFKANHKFNCTILKFIIFFKLDYIFSYRSYCVLGSGEQAKMKISKSIREVIRYLLKNC